MPGSAMRGNCRPFPSPSRSLASQDPSACTVLTVPMRPRDTILGDLEAIYKTSYEAAKQAEQPKRMEELDNSYQRDQLMMEIFLDVRDLLARQPAAPPGQSVLDQLDAFRRLAKR